MTDNYGEGRVIKKTGDSHVVWFPGSNRWVEFKEPAWFIFMMTEKKADGKAITEGLTKRYGLPVKEARRFLREVTRGINHASAPSGNLTPGAEDSREYINLQFTPCSTRHYLVNNRHITIIYGTHLLEQYIHRPLAYLETRVEDKQAIIFELYENRGNQHRYILRQARPALSHDKVFYDAGVLKHYLYSGITSHIYGIPAEGWMTYIHASAVTDGREAILLSSASGSGKSTLAALLQSPMAIEMGHRFYFMSDDFVPVDAHNKLAHVFPAALAVKEGSFPVISGLYSLSGDADSGFVSEADRQIRYLRPQFPDREHFKPREVKNIIFIKYGRNIKHSMKKLPVTEALAMFHQEAWVSHNPGHARTFIDWFVNVDCYRLEYSENKKAISAIADLFRENQPANGINPANCR
jgi:hypothetical protein